MCARVSTYTREEVKRSVTPCRKVGGWREKRDGWDEGTERRERDTSVSEPRHALLRIQRQFLHYQTLVWTQSRITAAPSIIRARNKNSYLLMSSTHTIYSRVIFARGVTNYLSGSLVSLVSLRHAYVKLAKENANITVVWRRARANVNRNANAICNCTR
ncbi:hypothetical protein PUN28_002705 [Cardiocondyla obscurior]|uniref:Uncharacterized protein n=1 Tax=Cardiocondyla obscurior TaxID=286306 RepID=A0AAW2GVP4_9HYME